MINKSTRREPIPQVEIKVLKADNVLTVFKSKGGEGYKKINGNLWLRGSVEQIKKMIPSASIIKSVGQNA